MPTVNYGTRKISFTHVINGKLKHAYITVDGCKGVILKSAAISEAKAKEIVCKKGKWILQKLKLVERMPRSDIVTGSRLLYLGRRYYVQVIEDASIKTATVVFNHSKFKIAVNPTTVDRKAAIDKALTSFFRQKAKLKILPRLAKWVETTGLEPKAVRFRKLSKRWGSCTVTNEIIINYDAVKLPFTIIDYIIVHELAHIKHKNHSRAFYREVAKYIPDWERVGKMLRKAGV